MLSVVDAIAHQTAVRSPEGFIERFSERIQALSANQDLLVRNEWKGSRSRT
jgi:two-component sensor histidine kinase